MQKLKLTLLLGLVGVSFRVSANCVPPEASQYRSLGCTSPDCEGLDLLPGQAECQNLDDCPRHYNNTMADYNPSVDQDLTLDDELRAWMSETMETYLTRVKMLYPPSHVDTVSRPLVDVQVDAGARAIQPTPPTHHVTWYRPTYSMA